MTDHAPCAVIGSAGLVGRALVRRLCDLGYKVHALQRRSTADDPRATYFYGDAADPRVVNACLNGVETVFYAAAYKKNVHVHTTQPFQTYVQNELPLLSFLSAAAAHPPARIVFLGSIYAETPPSLLGASTFDGYSAVKYAEEFALRAFGQETGTTCVFLRIAPIYGPGNDVDPRTANLIPSLLQRIHRAEGSLEVWGTGQRRLQMIYVDDVVENVVEAMKVSTNEVRRIGHPEVVSIDEVVGFAMDAYGKRLPLVHDPTKPDKATELYEFSSFVAPRVSLREGIMRTHAWMRDQKLYV